MPPVKPKARDDLTVVELDGEAVIYDEETTELHHLNPTATIVFGLCDGTSTMKQMSIDVSEAFGVPLEEVEPQIRTLIRSFRKVRLLVPSVNGRHYVPDRTEGTPA
jgi:hypothetical protein